jgi:hypothetical protein
MWKRWKKVHLFFNNQYKKIKHFSKGNFLTKLEETSPSRILKALGSWSGPINESKPVPTQNGSILYMARKSVLKAQAWKVKAQSTSQSLTHTDPNAWVNPGRISEPPLLLNTGLNRTVRSTWTGRIRPYLVFWPSWLVSALIWTVQNPI